MVEFYHVEVSCVNVINLKKLDDKVISSIGNGLCILIGITRGDTLADIKVKKILNIKVFENDNKKWSASVMDKQYEILCISQFTLYHVLKGNKLDFHRAMPAQESEPFYKNFLNELGKNYKPELIKDGIFGAMMQVSIQNNGPVTLEIESPIKPVKDSTEKLDKNDSAE
uniref:D-aminoacyl-tRNA deacylase 1 isoform X2 n=1 Tax=Vespula vulgaris TaxID=7454 RepID=UPI00223B0F34|nr:D-aminoacyl-tRNA deacylase 1 isoform X2 [Vespula vulgaris]